LKQPESLPLLILFARAPEVGQVKTRLAPVLSAAACAQLQEAMTVDLLDATGSLPVRRMLACTPTTAHPFFLQCAQKHQIVLRKQEGASLGDRIAEAMGWGFGEGFQRVALIGVDSPTLPLAFLREAFARLETHRTVLGPTLDGGYYLIGARDASPNIFTNIPWGTDRVFTETLNRFNEQHLSCHLLPFWYDVDRPADLNLLVAHSTFLARQGQPLPEQTLRMLRALSPHPPGDY